MGSRGNWLFAAGIAAVLLAVALGYLLILRPSQSSAPASVVVPLAAPVPSGRLARADGTVEIRSLAGEWRVAMPGAALEPGSDLRTAAGASAALDYGDAVHIDLAPESEISFDDSDEETTSVVVRDGLVTADVQPNSGRRVRVATAKGDATAETRDGRLHVLADETGRLQAAVSRGQATVSAQGRTVELAAGSQTTVEPGKPPAEPSLVPASLLLKVKWPPEGTTAKRRQIVSGTTSPGSRVRVGGTVVVADARGNFRALVELDEGSNELSAMVIDVLGRVEKSTSPMIRVDSKAPGYEIQTSPDLWRRKAPDKAK